jgi:hypothetical protein
MDVLSEIWKGVSAVPAYGEGTYCVRSTRESRFHAKGKFNTPFVATDSTAIDTGGLTPLLRLTNPSRRATHSSSGKYIRDGVALTATFPLPIVLHKFLGLCGTPWTTRFGLI